MPNFKFAIDRQVTMWYRTTYFIKSDNYEEAKNIMNLKLQSFEDIDITTDEHIAEFEYPLYETELPTEKVELVYIDTNNSSETVIANL